MTISTEDGVTVVDGANTIMFHRNEYAISLVPGIENVHIRNFTIYGLHNWRAKRDALWVAFKFIVFNKR
jgi:hypothetical protein